MSVFGRRLRATRVATGFREAIDFAKALGMLPARYQRMELGVLEPDLGELTQIANMTGHSVDWLVTGTEARR